MYFIVNTAFVNYLDQFPNLMESLEFPIIKKKTTFKQTLPIHISFNASKFDSDLPTAPKNLKDFYMTLRSNFLINRINFIL